MRVVDRGPGIPPAQLERVFEPFYRAGTAQDGHRGSGLGLAIARGFTEANGGSAARRVAARAGSDVRVRAAAGAGHGEHGSDERAAGT